MCIIHIRKSTLTDILQSTKIMIKKKRERKKNIEFNERLMSNMVLIIRLKVTEQE